jgi:type II secretory pathway component PulM
MVQARAATGPKAMTAREQGLIAAGVLVLILALGYSAWWQPLRQAETRELARIERLKRLDAALAQLPVQPAQQGSGAAVRPVEHVLEDTAAGQGLAITRLTVLPGGGVEAMLENAPFDAVILWLNALEADQNVKVDRLLIRALGGDGQVMVELVVGAGVTPTAAGPAE